MKIFIIISLIGLILLLIQNRYKPSVLFFGLASLFYLLGVIDLENWVSSYTNSSLLSLMLLLVVSLSFEKTVLVKYFSDFIIKNSYKKSLLRLGFFTVIYSAFVNNTPVVASLMGLVKNNTKHLPSRLLIPLSFFAIFGGTMTLVGSSVNLIVNSFVVERGLPSLKMFDFLFVGGLITLFGVITVYFASFLLPSYDIKDDKLDEHLIEASVGIDSNIIGKTIDQAKLNKMEYFSLVEIQRNGQIIIPVNDNEKIELNDKLVFGGDIEHIGDLKNIDGLHLSYCVDNNKLEFVDTIVNPQSNLIGLKVKDINFKEKFDATIISFKRGSYNVSKISEEIIHAGDRLILATGKNFQNLDNITENFYTISNIKQNVKFGNEKSFIVLISFMMAIGLSAIGIVSLMKALLVFLFGLLIFKAIDPKEIIKRFRYDVFIIVGSSLAIEKVFEDNGITKDLALFIVNNFGCYGVYTTFIAIFIFNVVLTQFMAKNAVAALTFPIAYATALGLGVNPIPFIFAVIYGTSASFIIPYGYATNLMVSSLGNYKIQDFIKIGLIVTLIYSLVVIIFVPIFFPF